LENQFKKSISISTPHKNNNKYRDKKENSSKKNNKRFKFLTKNVKLNEDYEDFDEYDSDSVLDESLNINNDSIFNKNEEVDSKINESTPTKFKSLFNTKTNINNNNLFTNKPLSSLPNYTYLSTKSKTGFFSQYSNFNRSYLNKNNILYPKNDDKMDTNKSKFKYIIIYLMIKTVLYFININIISLIYIHLLIYSILYYICIFIYFFI